MKLQSKSELVSTTTNLHYESCKIKNYTFWINATEFVSDDSKYFSLGD